MARRPEGVHEVGAWRVGGRHSRDTVTRRSSSAGEGADDRRAAWAAAQGRRSDVRIADQQHDVALAGPGPLEDVEQELQLSVAADERGEAAGGLDLEPGARLPSRDDLPGGDRLGFSLEGAETA